MTKTKDLKQELYNSQLNRHSLNSDKLIEKVISNKPFEGFDKDMDWLKSEMEKIWKEAENPNSDLYSEELLELSKEILKYHPNAFK